MQREAVFQEVGILVDTSSTVGHRVPVFEYHCVTMFILLVVYIQAIPSQKCYTNIGLILNS